MKLLGIDFETASAVDLKVHGAWRYSLDPSTRVWCAVVGWQGDDGELKVSTWEPGNPVPPEVYAALVDGIPFLAHNCTFEKAIWTNVLTPRHGWPDVPSEWEDTQAHAAAANLPITLEGLGAAVGAPVQKDTEGNALMKKMCQLDPDGKGGWTNRRDTPENRARLLAYCRTDVESMLSIWPRLPKMIPLEASVWRLDQRINARGVFIDQEFAKKLRVLAEKRAYHLALESNTISDNDVIASTRTREVKDFLKERGVELPVAKRVRVTGEAHESETIGRRVAAGLAAAEDVDPLAKAILENRLEASKATSLAKLKKVGSLVDPRDGRLRNALQFCAAHTGRWSSRGLQIHNMPRDKRGPEEAEKALVCIEAGDLQGLTALGKPLEILSMSLRGIIAAAPGHDIIGADFSAIEAVGVAWLAGQQDVLDVFADPKQDIYIYAAKKIGSNDRQLGKVVTLACGYGMGAIKFADTAAGYGVKLSLKDARRVVLDWRAANEAIVQFWYDLEAACHAAAQTPGSVHRVGKFLRVACNGTCLMILLPSGRAIRYWRPSVREVEKTIETVDEDGNIVKKKMASMELQFWTPAKDAVSMEPESTYSGKLCENATQALARELLAAALLRLEDRYGTVIHVHDSIAAEVPAGTGDVAEFCSIMAQAPHWAPGLPLIAKGYRAKRFKG